MLWSGFDVQKGGDLITRVGNNLPAKGGDLITHVGNKNLSTEGGDLHAEHFRRSRRCCGAVSMCKRVAT